MIGVVESGNSDNVHRALRFIGQESEIYSADAIYDAIVLPGIGHFGSFMKTLTASGIDGPALSRAAKVLAICVGMQALYEGSDEAPDVPGLGLLPGRCKKLEGRTPFVGWRYVPEAHGHVYFVHSYGAGVDTVSHQNIVGVQFHPERSGMTGLAFLKEWADA